MTLQDLSKYYETRKRLLLCNETLQSLRAAAEHITPALTGMPRNCITADNVSKYAIQIADLEKEILEGSVQATREKKEAQRFIDKIEDGYVRTVFSLRFIECLSWSEIAVVIGGNNTENSVKKICYRFLNAKE